LDDIDEARSSRWLSLSRFCCTDLGCFGILGSFKNLNGHHVSFQPPRPHLPLQENKAKQKYKQNKKTTTTKNKSTWKQNVFNLRYEDEVSLSKRVEFEDNVMIKLDLMRSFRQKP